MIVRVLSKHSTDPYLKMNNNYEVHYLWHDAAFKGRMRLNSCSPSIPFAFSLYSSTSKQRYAEGLVTQISAVIGVGFKLYLEFQFLHFTTYLKVKMLAFLSH